MNINAPETNNLSSPLLTRSGFLRYMSVATFVACTSFMTGCRQSVETSTDVERTSPDEIIVAGANVQHKAYTVGGSDAIGKDENTLVACLGDSLTWGEGVFDPAVSSWPARLATLLGRGYEVHNYGMLGAALLDDALVPYRQYGLVEEVSQLAPDYAIVMFGTNDARVAWWDPDEYEQALSDVVEELQRYSDVHVVLMAPPRLFENEFGDLYDGYDNNPIIRDFVRPIVQRVAQTYGTDYVDLYELTCDHPEWYWDGRHLNDLGYQAVATTLYQTVFAPSSTSQS